MPVVTAETIINMFLWNSQQQPTDLLDQNLIRPTNDDTQFLVTAQSYMGAVGRFALPSRFDLIQKFFTQQGIPPKLDSQGNVTYYTKVEIAQIFGLTSYGLTINQYVHDDGVGDYAYRVLIWNTGDFKINDDAKFWIEADGTRHIEDFAIEPRDSDNFDFEGGTIPTDIANDFYLQPRIDPFNLGRTVNIEFDGSVATRSYNQFNYLADLQTENGWTTFTPGAALASIQQLLDALHEDGIISPVDAEGRPIEYGTVGNDTMSWSASEFPLYEGITLGSTFVSGLGDDRIVGSDLDDRFVGGSDDDTFIGLGGDDEFWGGSFGVQGGSADGIDTADYSGNTSPITIRFSGYGGTPALTVDDGTGATDTLHSIEKIVATFGTDYLRLSGEIPSGYNLTVDMGDGADVIANAEGASGRIVVEIGTNGTGTASSPEGGTINLLNAKTQIIGSYYDDEITDLAEHDGLKRIDGNDGDDVITVDGSDAMIRGGYDDDTLTGGTGNDVLYGDDGDDILHGGEGSDFLETRHADTEAETAEEEDELHGDEGHDYLRASANSTGATLSGGAGNDAIDARGSSATVVFGAGDGHDLILSDRALGDGYELGQGFDGVSRIDMTSVSKSGVTLIWDPQYLVEHILPNGNPQDTPGYLIREGDLAIRIDATGDTILIRNVRGSTSYWNDPSEASQPPFDGTFDQVQFYELLETIEFSDGHIDFADFLGSSPLVALQFGSVAAYATARDDYEDAVAATPGGDGGTSGDDGMEGGAGDDNFGSSGGNDTIDGGGGRDVLNLFGTRENFAITSLGGGVFTIEDLTGFEGKITATSIEAVYFAGDNQEHTQEDIFGYYGTAGDDIVTGSALDNELFGLAGNDDLHGLDGDDVIDGGDGEDTAHFVASSTDYFIYNWADGLIVSDADDDDGSYEGWDTLINVEAIHFAGDNVTIDVDDIPPFGTSGDDTITGTGRADRLYGQDGNDALSGGDGDDNLQGGVGNDSYAGGAGNDWMWDDDGNDVYVYNPGDGDDRIQDGWGTDALEFGSGIATNDVTVTADGDDYVLTLSGSGSVRLQGAASSGSSAIEEVRFADSTVWTDEDLYDMAFGQVLRQGAEVEAPMAFQDAPSWRSWGAGVMELRADLAVPI